MASENREVRRSDLISDGYLGLQRELHKNPNYGVASLHFAPLVRDLLEQSGASSISDYGAGKCNLKRW